MFPENMFSLGCDFKERKLVGKNGKYCLVFLSDFIRFFKFHLHTKVMKKSVTWGNRITTLRMKSWQEKSPPDDDVLTQDEGHDSLWRFLSCFHGQPQDVMGKLLLILILLSSYDFLGHEPSLSQPSVRLTIWRRHPLFPWVITIESDLYSSRLPLKEWYLLWYKDTRPKWNETTYGLHCFSSFDQRKEKLEMCTAIKAEAVTGNESHLIRSTVNLSFKSQCFFNLMNKTGDKNSILYPKKRRDLK